MTNLKNFTLSTGTKLSDATGAEVADAAQAYLAAAGNMLLKQRWLAAIAAAVPPASTVATVLTEDQLLAFRTQAAEGNQ